MKRGPLFGAISLLIGTVFGAGILGMPYVISKSGFLTGALLLLILSVAIVLLYLYVGEIVLRTKGNHQLTGYSGIYLGKPGKILMVISTLFVSTGAMTAYIIGVGESLSVLFNHAFSTFVFSTIFFIIFSALIYFGLKAVEESEMLLNTVVILIILSICIFAISKVNISNLASFNLFKIFYPYGVILFALSGAVAIPEMREELSTKTRLLKKAILIGSIIPVVLYFLFTLIVIGVTGANTTEIATIGLGNLLGTKMLIFGNLFAILTMATSFLTIGLGLKETYNYDFKINKNLAWLLAVSVPFLIFLIEKSFTKTIGIAGGVFIGLEAILIILMFNKAKKLGKRIPEYEIKKSNLINIFLIIIFVLGAVYTILNAFNIIK